MIACTGDDGLCTGDDMLSLTASAEPATVETMTTHERIERLRSLTAACHSEVKIRGTVKKHDIFNSIPQTVLTRAGMA